MADQQVITITELAQLLIERADNKRIVVAVAGAPGSGKSFIAEQLQATINNLAGATAAILPMDGFHFDDMILEQRDLRPTKGAPNTYDVGGLFHMISRLRQNNEAEIAVPVFDRSLEIARAGARIITSDSQILIVEGNYLLLDYAPWSSLAPLFDITVSIDVSEEELRKRLIHRWQSHGIDPELIEPKVEANDLPNGRTVIKHSIPADYVIESDWSLFES